MQDNYYEPHVVPDPSRPFIFHSCQLSRGCMPHWHVNIELLYFHSTGKVIRDRAEYQVRPDDLIIFGSNTLHAVPVDESNSYDCLIVDGQILHRQQYKYIVARLRLRCARPDRFGEIPRGRR